ncbi:MAG: phytanoyl-CoA dioxygenase family protein [Xanthomonadales bacterium]|nr:phytanoyl-CoA dioxygenase family protein [Xanthomonadales bacterium]
MRNKQLARAISKDEIAEYSDHGVVMLKGVIDMDWIEYLRDAVEVAMAQPGPLAEEYAKGAGRFFGDLDVAKRHAPFRDFIFNSPAAEIIGSIMGSSKVNFFYDQLLVKEPGTAERTPWHQDQPYWAVSGFQVASIWLPLDRVAKDSSLKYVKGSHRWGSYNPHNFSDNTPYKGTGLPELPNIDANRDEYEILGWDMQPGDCLVFQAMIVHGSDGNSSLQHRRRAWATRWTGDDARFLVRPGQVAIPTSDPGLQHGEPMDCDDFPVIWRSPN